MRNILQEIIETRKKDLELVKEQFPQSALEQAIPALLTPKYPFIKALASPSPSGIHIIAEVKKASPSKGIICQNFVPLNIAQAYQKGGASALSVLTEEKYFMGCNDYLQEIAYSVSLPVLRKDFIVDPYQIYEARCIGANAFLLIMACLTDKEVKDFIRLGKELELDALVEVHSEEEVKRALDCGAEIIGINNRNLETFETSLNTTEKLRPLIPNTIPVVSESGISTREDIETLKKGNIQAVLIGESLVKEPEKIITRLGDLLL